jgi:hypothetical protein
VNSARAIDIKEAQVLLGAIALMLSEIVLRIKGMIAQHNHVPDVFGY